MGIQEEFGVLLDKYYDAFGDIYPLAALSTENIEKIIEHCLKENKDVYELGYLTLDDYVMY